MRVPTIDDRFVDFLEGPSLDRWFAVREQLILRPDFDPYSPLWQQLEAKFVAGSFREVLELGEQLGSNGCLSPRFHFLTGVAALESGQSDRAAWKRKCTQACLGAILETGSGTAESPFLSTYPGDCYDVLQALGLVARGQTLVDLDGEWRDVLRADDGLDYWFDVQDLLERNPESAADRLTQHARQAAMRPA